MEKQKYLEAAQLLNSFVVFGKHLNFVQLYSRQ